MLKVVILAGIAGCIGTGAGGALGCLVRKDSIKTVAFLLCIAAGAMLGIVFFDLIPESLKLSGLWVTLGASSVGAVGAFLLNDAVAKHKRTLDEGERRHDRTGAAADRRHNRIGEVADDGRHNRMAATGMIMFAAIALHDLPEGVIIGAGEAARTGLIHTLLIAMHNVPEGMSVSIPLRAGGKDNVTAVFYSVLSGLPSVFGGALGYLVGGISETVIALCLSCAGGAMLAVVFAELLPSAVTMKGVNNTTNALGVLIGVTVALLFVALA